MMKNFFRKVAFGIGPNEEVPSDPLNWALSQVNEIPDLSWKGKIYTEKELRILNADNKNGIAAAARGGI